MTKEKFSGLFLSAAGIVLSCFLTKTCFFFPSLQLLDLCVLDTGSLQFSYSILAASALNHMLPVKIEQVTGKESETYKPPL